MHTHGGKRPAHAHTDIHEYTTAERPEGVEGYPEGLEMVEGAVADASKEGWGVAEERKEAEGEAGRGSPVWGCDSFGGGMVGGGGRMGDMSEEGRCAGDGDDGGNTTRARGGGAAGEGGYWLRDVGRTDGCEDGKDDCVKREGEEGTWAPADVLWVLWVSETGLGRG